MGFFQNTDRRQPTSMRGAWRAAWQLHLARAAYQIEAFLVKVAVIALVLALVWLFSHH